MDDLLKGLTQEDFAGQASGMLVEHGTDPRTIPALRSAFINSTSKSVKQLIAMAMLRLKVIDPIYFDYLLSFGSAAVEDNPPSLYLLKENGAFDYTRSNPEFERWCRAHGRDLALQAQNVVKEFPVDLMLLSAVHDDRTAPVFRKGLDSNDPVIKLLCIYGLAGLQKPEDIGRLISTAEINTPTIERETERALAMCYKNPLDRAEIAKRLQGSRLYEPFLKAVLVADQIEAQNAARNKK